MSHSSLWQATLESLRSFACACQRLGLESSLIWAKPKIGLPTLFMAMLIRCFMLVITPQFYWRWRRRGITDVSHLLHTFASFWRGLWRMKDLAFSFALKNIVCACAAQNNIISTILKRE